jgi:hypothetical protein
MSNIAFSIYRIIRSVIFFWIPKSETEVAMDRINVILEKKETLILDIFSGKQRKLSHKDRLDELIQLIEETKLAMSDNEYIIHNFEIENRKKLVDICNTILDDLNSLITLV